MIDLIHGDCIDILKTLPDNSVDAVITDPPYVGVIREYGFWTHEAWFTLMDEVVKQVRRILKSHGSAMFILGPNMERIGTMRTWVFEFIVKWAKKWNWIQDVWWWNFTMLPVSCVMPSYGLMRPSIKSCAWFGAYDCYRNQDAILWKPSDSTIANRAIYRGSGIKATSAGDFPMNRESSYCASEKRGGVTPFNIIPISNSGSVKTAGLIHHSAQTPPALCEWWVRYITKEGDTVLDPFSGSATVGLACKNLGRNYIGIEKSKAFNAIAKRRLGLDSTTKEERKFDVIDFFRDVFGETESERKKREALEFFKKMGL